MNNANINEAIKEIEAQLSTCEKTVKNLPELLKDYKIEEKQKKLQDTYFEIKNDMDDQLRTIRKKEFEIAVVGREKAGKSSLLNAWIGFDLLPNERNRCTYTTTEIRSCVTEDEQKYIIEYFTSKEFNRKMGAQYGGQNVDNVTARAMDFLAQQENEEIEKFREEIETYLDRQDVMVTFKNFEQIRSQLKSAISSPGMYETLLTLTIVNYIFVIYIYTFKSSK
jgi:ribosome-interacting GTPase 1